MRHGGNLNFGGSEMTPVIFWAEVAPTAHALQFGDAARIEIWSKPTNADRGAAMALLALKQKRLRLRFYVAADTAEPVADFGAALAQINSSLVFTRERAKVKFDVPDTELFNAAKLIGYDDRALRLEILMEGDGERRRGRGVRRGHLARAPFPNNRTSIQRDSSSPVRIGTASAACSNWWPFLAILLLS
jgi:hypothetical protein